MKNQQDEPVPGIPIRATFQGKGDVEPVVTTTDKDGWFEFNLPDGQWLIEFDPVALINSGYFCRPGFCWPPEQCGIAEIPVLPTVPLRPVLKPVVSGDQSAVVVELTFDWAEGLDPDILQQYRVERSSDMNKWDPVGTVLLSDPPNRLVDPEADGAAESAFYRAVHARQTGRETT